MSFKPHKQQFPECKTRLPIGLGTHCTVLETCSRIIYDRKPKLPIQCAHAVRADQAPTVWHGYWQLSIKFYLKAQRQVSLLAAMLTQRGFLFYPVGWCRWLGRRGQCGLSILQRELDFPDVNLIANFSWSPLLCRCYRPLSYQRCVVRVFSDPPVCHVWGISSWLCESLSQPAKLLTFNLKFWSRYMALIPPCTLHNKGEGSIACTSCNCNAPQQNGKSAQL